MILSIGHRGACVYEPENTLRSFARALELGADMIEFDVHVCASGEAVVIHDAALKRTTNGLGYVKDKTLEELKTLDAGKGEKIPVLEEVFDLVNKRAGLNIELKSENAPVKVCSVIREYITEKGWSYKNILVSSFLKGILKEVRSIDACIRIGVLTRSLNQKVLSAAHELEAYSINPIYTQITKKIVKKYHDEGFKLYAWTVDEEKGIRKLRDAGVDGIFSGAPELINSENG